MFNKEEIFQRYPALTSCRPDMEKALTALIITAQNDGTVLICGNGGSCADSDHIVGELMKGFLKKRSLNIEEKMLWERSFGLEGRAHAEVLQKGIRAISLPAQAAVLSAFANDCDPDSVYAQLTWNYGNSGDYFIGLSTSGNSANVLAAAQAAKLRGCFVLGMTGEKESQISALADVAIQVPETETYKVQEYHLPIYHWLCAGVEDALF